MKKLFCIILCLCLSSCWYHPNDDDTTSPPYEPPYEAVILKRSELNSSIVLQEKQATVEPAKIYVVEDYIFINDKRRGFHIFDNSDPVNPVKKSFLKVPGCTDIAIRNSTFYINQATDLVVLTFDLNDFSFEIVKRVENVFPKVASPDGYIEHANEDSVVVNWLEK